jgi:hypothetical protein
MIAVSKYFRKLLLEFRRTGPDRHIEKLRCRCASRAPLNTRTSRIFLKLAHGDPGSLSTIYQLRVSACLVEFVFRSCVPAGGRFGQNVSFTRAGPMFFTRGIPLSAKS